jgi:hypothetical protein
MKRYVVAILLVGLCVAMGKTGLAYFPFPRFSGEGLSCAAPSGAMSAIEREEMFIGTLRGLKFGCVPMTRGVCEAYFCTAFTAVDEQDKRVIGYVWRNIWNEPTAVACSPDGGKAGTFYGECPVGTPVPTVYRCPWCEPNLNAKADTRGVARE